MYDFVLNDVQQSQSLSKDDVDFARTVLQLALLSSKALSANETSEVLDCSPADVQSVLRRMTSVIRLPSDENEAITAFHASFGEYIQDPRRCSVTEFLIEPTSSHTEWATKFLEIFVRAAEDGITGIEYDWGNCPPRKLQIAARELPYHVPLASDPTPTQLRQLKDEFCRNAMWAWVFVWQWSSDADDNSLVQYIKEAGFSTVCRIEDKASLHHSMVKRILSQLSHLDIPRSCPTGGRRKTIHEGNSIVDEVVFHTFKIELKWDSVGWTVANRDPRTFARMLWKWSQIQHPNIVPLGGIGFESLLETPERSIVHVPSMSCYSALKNNWYPELLLTFQQNSAGAVRMVLELAHALQYLREVRLDGKNTWDAPFTIESIVLSDEGKVMIHPLFLAHMDSIDPSPRDAERQSLAKSGFTYWRSPKGNMEQRMVWQFGCVLYKMMTDGPPLKRYHDLVMGSNLIDDEPIDSEAPLEAYRDLIRSVAMLATGPYGDPLTASNYWWSREMKPPYNTLENEDILRCRYQTAIGHLLNDLQISEVLKSILRVCWVVDEEKRSAMHDIIAHLTAILDGLRDQNSEGT